MRKSSWQVAALFLAAGCGGGAVESTVQFQDMIPPCVRISATDAKTGGSTTGTFEVDVTRGQYRSAIYPQSGWGSSLTVTAEGLEHDCTGSSISSSSTPATVPDQGFNEVTLVLTATDADGDGWVSTAATLPGHDCNDNDHAINPDAAEICGDGIDNNCNGQVDEGC